MHLNLPLGLTARPLRSDEAEATFRVLAADERAALGRVEIELADIVAEWQRPSFNLATSSVGVYDGEQLIACADLTHHERGSAAVDPAYQRRGIGSALAGWMQATAASKGATIVGSPVPEGSPADRLLTRLGYHVRWTSWVLRVPPGREIPHRQLPTGYRIREAAPSEYAAAHEVVEDAFLEWSRRERESFADFAAEIIGRPGFAPWQFRIVLAPDDTVAAVATVALVPETGEAYVSRLATRADQRGRGLAQCLLIDVFAAAGAHGATASGLSTDSRTGALSLYQKVGMEVTDVWLHRAIHLP
ncbi:MAG: GNAT family N-acetyltransferase [Nocardioides sp.]